jgi:hypothetical protein
MRYQLFQDDNAISGYEDPDVEIALWVEDENTVLSQNSQNVVNRILSETVSHYRRIGIFSGLKK